MAGASDFKARYRSRRCCENLGLVRDRRASVRTVSPGTAERDCLAVVREPTDSAGRHRSVMPERYSDHAVLSCGSPASRRAGGTVSGERTPKTQRGCAERQRLDRASAPGAIACASQPPAVDPERAARASQGGCASTFRERQGHRSTGRDLRTAAVSAGEVSVPLHLEPDLRVHAPLAAGLVAQLRQHEGHRCARAKIFPRSPAWHRLSGRANDEGGCQSQSRAGSLA